MKKNGTLLMVVWLLSAILLVAAGVGCMVNSADITSILAGWMEKTVRTSWKRN